MLAKDSALALPDQDQADCGKRRAVAGPPDLLDHEARLRPVDRAGALTDPQQPNGEREKANDQKQFTHRIFLDRAGRAVNCPRGPEWRARSPGARVGNRGLGLSLRAEQCLRSRRHKKAPDDAGAFESLKSSEDQYFATSGPVQLKR